MSDKIIDVGLVPNKTPLEIFQDVDKRYKENPNGFSLWFNKIKNIKEFKQPLTTVIPIDFELYNLMVNVYDHREGAEKIFSDKFTKLVEDARIKAGIEYPMFMKTGLFSNKFEFHQCLQLYKEHTADHYLSMNYAAMCMSCETSTEVVIRELIKVKPYMYLYEGMPMNIEFRCFINFDTKKVVAINDYWHESIENNIPMSQKGGFRMFKNKQKEEFNKYKNIIIKKLYEDMDNFDLVGSWTVDIMLDMFGDLWITDMALANQSWGLHLLNDKERMEINET